MSSCPHVTKVCATKRFEIFHVYVNFSTYLCCLYSNYKHARFFSQGYFLRMKTLIIFKNEQTNLLSNLQGGHERSLLIIIDNFQKKWRGRSEFRDIVNDILSKLG